MPQLGKAIEDHGFQPSVNHYNALAELRVHPGPCSTSERPRQWQQERRRDANEVDAESYTDDCCSDCSPRPQWVDCEHLQMTAVLLHCAQTIAAASRTYSST